MIETIFTVDHAGTFAALLNEKFENASEFGGRNFSVTRGQKFDRIVQKSDADLERGNGGSVHAFVEKSTGHVFKAAGWKAPAKHIRFTNVQDAALAADLYGGYLYIR